MWPGLIKIEACAETYTFWEWLIGSVLYIAKVTCKSKIEYGKVDTGCIL